MQSFMAEWITSFEKPAAKPSPRYPLTGFRLAETDKDERPTSAATMPHLPEDKPNHLLGIGDIASIIPLNPIGNRYI